VSDHSAADHEISGSPYERMRRVLARHLCGWIVGHNAPHDQFLHDADIILRDAHEAGIRFHLATPTGSPTDGLVDVQVVHAAP
jgi:hypothetical protein